MEMQILVESIILKMYYNNCVGYLLLILILVSISNCYKNSLQISDSYTTNIYFSLMSQSSAGWSGRRLCSRVIRRSKFLAPLSLMVESSTRSSVCSCELERACRELGEALEPGLDWHISLPPHSIGQNSVSWPH